MTNQILLMRHGETSYNKQRKFLGQVNAPMSTLGEEQSAKTAAALAAWGPDRIVTSPLERCELKIARPASELCKCEVIVDERLSEFDFGPLEGMTYEGAAKSGWPMPWGVGSESWPPPEGGERMSSFILRVKSAARDIECYEGKTAVVCHGGVIRAFFGAWLGLEVTGWNRIVVDNVCSFLFMIHAKGPMLEKAGLSPDELLHL